MKGPPWWRSVSAFVLALIVPLCVPSVIGAGVSDHRGGGDGRTALKEQITILYDAFGKVTAMKKDWGFAALVEIGGRRILFDTGNNPDVLAQNVKAAGVDLGRLDFVVMSHRHGDHMGGMTYLLRMNPTVKIYAPQEGFGVYGASLPGSFYRKDESLPQEMRYYDGKPPEVLRFGAAWPKANIVLIDKTTEVAPGVTLIAQISERLVWRAISKRWSGGSAVGLDAGPDEQGPRRSPALGMSRTQWSEQRSASGTE